MSTKGKPLLSGSRAGFPQKPKASYLSEAFANVCHSQGRAVRFRPVSRLLWSFPGKRERDREQPRHRWHVPGRPGVELRLIGGIERRRAQFLGECARRLL